MYTRQTDPSFKQISMRNATITPKGKRKKLLMTMSPQERLVRIQPSGFFIKKYARGFVQGDKPN